MGDSGPKIAFSEDSTLPRPQHQSELRQEAQVSAPEAGLPKPQTQASIPINLTPNHDVTEPNQCLESHAWVQASAPAANQEDVKQLHCCQCRYIQLQFLTCDQKLGHVWTIPEKCWCYNCIDNPIHQLEFGSVLLNISRNRWYKIQLWEPLPPHAHELCIRAGCTCTHKSGLSSRRLRYATIMRELQYLPSLHIHSSTLGAIHKCRRTGRYRCHCHFTW